MWPTIRLLLFATIAGAAVIPNLNKTACIEQNETLSPTYNNQDPIRLVSDESSTSTNAGNKLLKVDFRSIAENSGTKIVSSTAATEHTDLSSTENLIDVDHTGIANSGNVSNIHNPLLAENSQANKKHELYEVNTLLNETPDDDTIKSNRAQMNCDNCKAIPTPSGDTKIIILSNYQRQIFKFTLLTNGSVRNQILQEIFVSIVEEALGPDYRINKTRIIIKAEKFTENENYQNANSVMHEESVKSTHMFSTAASIQPVEQSASTIIPTYNKQLLTANISVNQPTTAEDTTADGGPGKSVQVFSTATPENPVVQSTTTAFSAQNEELVTAIPTEKFTENEHNQNANSVMPEECVKSTPKFSTAASIQPVEQSTQTIIPTYNKQLLTANITVNQPTTAEDTTADGGPGKSAQVFSTATPEQPVVQSTATTFSAKNEQLVTAIPTVNQPTTTEDTTDGKPGKSVHVFSTAIPEHPVVLSTAAVVSSHNELLLTANTTVNQHTTTDDTTADDGPKELTHLFLTAAPEQSVENSTASIFSAYVEALLTAMSTVYQNTTTEDTTSDEGSEKSAQIFSTDLPQQPIDQSTATVLSDHKELLVTAKSTVSQPNTTEDATTDGGPGKSVHEFSTTTPEQLVVQPTTAVVSAHNEPLVTANPTVNQPTTTEDKTTDGGPGKSVHEFSTTALEQLVVQSTAAVVSAHNEQLITANPTVNQPTATVDATKDGGPGESVHEFSTATPEQLVVQSTVLTLVTAISTIQEHTTAENTTTDEWSSKSTHVFPEAASEQLVEQSTSTAIPNGNEPFVKPLEAVVRIDNSSAVHLNDEPTTNGTGTGTKGLPEDSMETDVVTPNISEVSTNEAITDSSSSASHDGTETNLNTTFFQGTSSSEPDDSDGGIAG